MILNWNNSPHASNLAGVPVVSILDDDLSICSRVRLRLTSTGCYTWAATWAHVAIADSSLVLKVATLLLFDGL